MTLISVDEFKEYTRNELLLEDEEVLGVLEATDDLLADLCQRRWVVAGDTATPRIYSPRSWSDVIRVHDCTLVSSVVADGVTVSPSEYQLEPLNGLDWAGNPRPYEQVRYIGNRWPFDNFRATVTVTARWGWPSIPSPIIRAARVLSKDIAMHRDISFGVAVVPDIAAIRVRQASLVSDLIKNWRRPEAMGGIGGPT
jgi:hypothetical protein